MWNYAVFLLLFSIAHRRRPLHIVRPSKKLSDSRIHQVIDKQWQISEILRPSLCALKSCHSQMWTSNLCSKCYVFFSAPTTFCFLAWIIFPEYVDKSLLDSCGNFSSSSVDSARRLARYQNHQNQFFWVLEMCIINDLHMNYHLQPPFYFLSCAKLCKCYD